MKQVHRQLIALGLQETNQNLAIRSLGKKRQGLEVMETPKAFPRPKGHCISDTLSFAALLVALTLVGAIVWNFESFEWTPRQVGYFFLNMMLSILPVTWMFHMLYPSFDRKRVQRAKRKAVGRIIATDYAGRIVQNDAQQRALVEVIHQNKRYLFVANQEGLAVATEETVEVSWSSVSQLCWIHTAS